METFADLVGIVKCVWVGILSFFVIGQKLEDKSESLRELASDKIQRGKKRKREEDLQQCVIESTRVLEQVVCDQRVLIESRRNSQKDDKLSRYGLVGLSRGCHIPVKELIGQVALSYLEKLESLLLDEKVGRIAIHGNQGSGKTTLMKNLHNRALKWVERFDYVVWITLSHELGMGIKHVQDAIAAAVRCDLSNIEDLSLRAQKLSYTLSSLKSFVLFLDITTPIFFSLQEVGIPVPSQGSSCKLVITTTSPMVCGMLDCFCEVKLGPLPETDALQLFIHEAGIDVGSDSLLNDIATSLAKECCGVPRLIVYVANRMCGIDDICEWRFALFEMKTLVKEGKLSSRYVIDELEHQNEAQKIIM